MKGNKIALAYLTVIFSVYFHMLILISLLFVLNVLFPLSDK